MENRLYYTILSVIVYVIMTNPYTYKMMDKVMGGVVKMARYDGCPTMMGLMMSAMMYGVVIYMMMNMEGVLGEMKRWMTGWTETDIEENEIPEVKVKEDE